jgi:hypothetical protein
MQNAAEEIGNGAASAAVAATYKSAPPVVVSGLAVAGISLQEWVYVLTVVWLVLQMIGWTWDRFIKARRDLAELEALTGGEGAK